MGQVDSACPGMKDLACHISTLDFDFEQIITNKGQSGHWEDQEVLVHSVNSAVVLYGFVFPSCQSSLVTWLGLLGLPSISFSLLYHCTNDHSSFKKSLLTTSFLSHGL